jgi:spore germination protein
LHDDPTLGYEAVMKVMELSLTIRFSPHKLNEKGECVMFVYTVKQGDSLFSISMKYNASLDPIRNINELTNGNIVPGQALFIPQSIYTVQPGDSLYLISKMSFIPVDTLAAVNNIWNPSQISPGMRLVIPELPQYTIQSMGFVTLRTPEQDQELSSQLAPLVTLMPLFEYHFYTDGSLSELNDQVAIETARAHKSAPLATITNLTETGFSEELTHHVLNHPEIRERLINNIFNLVSTKQYAGVTIDFEGIGEEDRDLFSGFLRQLRDRLKTRNYIVSIAVPPKPTEDIPWLKGYDYGAIGSVMDFVFIMAYDWHHSGSAPGPVAPISEVRQTIEFALTNMNRKKVLLGMPRYGYNWTLPDTQQSVGRATSSLRATMLAMKHQVPIRYSEQFQAPFFNYVDETGHQHIVWFEDSRSFGEKFKLVREYQLGGMGAWQLALGFPQAPWLMRKFFTIEKII